ncbi:MAG: penicillin acylase family protein, partial [Thermoanaerobaculia bacterium]|nr:penicillin acylase family protein [Thermoanaerobaculia bacterium]
GAARRGLGELRPEVRRHVEAFAAGINAYYDAHRDEAPPWWGDRRVEPAMVLAFGRMFLYNWSIDEAYGDLERGGVEPGVARAQRGSNQFAVAPERSQSGAAILAIDPHLSWSGPSRFWEFRIHAGELQGSGVSLPGFPYIGLGHTRFLAWAMTTGGPDTADVYELRLADDGSDRYLHDDEWRPLVARTISLEVADAEPVTRTLWSSHHGPVIARDGNRAWAARIAYGDIATGVEAWYELNFGTDYEGAVRAMETGTVFPQNVMVADTAGNIYYQRTGRVPIRPDGYDWSRPVPGTTSATEWTGVHPASDHLQVLNPPQGYMQNCNVPPDAMMVDSPFRLEGATPYLYGSLDYGPRDGWTNQRGARALELLAGDDSVSVEEAMAWVTDVRPFGADRWLVVLAAALDRRQETGEPIDGEAEDAAERLLAWDLQLAAESREAALYEAWRRRLDRDPEPEKRRALTRAVDDWYAVVGGRSPREPKLSDEDLQRVWAGFEGGLADLRRRATGLDTTYGDVHRVGRGEQSWPLGGGGGRIGTTTLRNVSYTPEREDGTRWGRAGQSSTQVVVMSEPPQSWIYLPLGVSDRAGSPHFADQAERLFSPRRLKESWWLAEDLAGHIESRTELPGLAGGEGSAEEGAIR